MQNFGYFLRLVGIESALHERYPHVGCECRHCRDYEFKCDVEVCDSRFLSKDGVINHRGKFCQDHGAVPDMLRWMHAELSGAGNVA